MDILGAGLFAAGDSLGAKYVWRDPLLWRSGGADGCDWSGLATDCGSGAALRGRSNRVERGIAREIYGQIAFRGFGNPDGGLLRNLPAEGVPERKD